MSPFEAVKSLESIIGRLTHLNANIEGNQLQEAIREVARVRDRVMVRDLKIKKTPKTK